MAWEPDRRSNFFFSPPAHLCAVTYMTEISLIVTLNNQFTHSLTQRHPFSRLLRHAGDTKDVFSTWTPGVLTGVDYTAVAAPTKDGQLQR